MAYNMNISVVAEGVENTENIDFLKKLGCPRAQGYYYSRPLPGSGSLGIYAQYGEVNSIWKQKLGPGCEQEWAKLFLV